MAANMVIIEKQHVGFMKGNFLMFDRADVLMEMNFCWMELGIDTVDERHPALVDMENI